MIGRTNSFIALLGACAMLSACNGGKPDAGNDAGNGMGQAAPGETGQPPQAPDAPAPQRINVGERVLSMPSDFQVAVAFYNIIGLSPPFNEWARADPRSRSANEFQRAEVAGRIQQELLLAAQASQGVGFFEINTSSNFGEYDMAAQGFRLAALESSRYYSWNYDNRTYKLTLENGDAAQLWRIPQDRARAFVESGGSRNVNLKLRIRVVGAIPESNGGGTLQGRIVSYEVFDGSGNKVGEMALQ